MIVRHAEATLREALADRPVVLVLGPRQCGKSTLCEAVTGPEGAGGGRTYVTLDDPIALAEAQRDPGAFFRTYAPPLTLDEVQRAPSLFLPLKLAVDRKRTPGAYLLTGSANVLALPKMADSLAGRMEIVDLMPFSQGEIEGEPDGFVAAVLGEEFTPQFRAEGPVEVAARIVRGGFPEPAMKASEARRDAWHAAYVRAMLERDVRDVADIEGLRQMPLLLDVLAARAGTVLNAASLAAETHVPYTSLRRYLALLQAIYLLVSVGSWSAGAEGKSLAKSPKLYFLDTGLRAHLARVTPRALTGDRLRFGAMLENFVATELLKACRRSPDAPRLSHLRTVRQLEVDFVLEGRDGGVVGVDVRASETLHPDDARGLRYLRELAGDRFRRGVVLYLGSTVQPLGPDLVGVPLGALWGTPTPG